MAEPLKPVLDWSDPDYDYGDTRDVVTTPDGITETFFRGFGAGIEGIKTDTEYFKGLANTLIGDDQAAAQNIANARQSEEQNANQFGDLQTFEEFLDNPSFGGFFSQVAKNVGQVTPYLGTTIGGGLGGAAITGLAKVGLSSSSKQVTKRLVKDAFEKKLKGEAMPEEERVLAIAYRLAQRNNPGGSLSLRGGAAAGMYAQEYSSMAGSNFGETLDFLSQDEAALRAAGLAIPQAFIGLKGEQMLTKVLMRDLGEIAAKRSTKDGSTFSTFAKTLGKNTARGGATESAAEVLQEGISVANRFNIDDEYTQQDAALRIGESAFAGFFGGAGIAGAGGVATGSLRGASDIMGKAKDFIEQARQQQTDSQVDKEQYGTDSMGYSTPEPRSAVNAQLRSALDRTSARHSIWIEGPNAEYDASPDTTKEVDIQGETFYTRFIPGRGTIISRNFDVAEEVAKSEASESALAEALGYTGVKPLDGDIAIEALDRGGNVVWQQGTNEEGVAGAFAAAEKQMPEGGSVRRVSVKEALENRKKLFEEEQGPQVRNVNDDYFAGDEDSESSADDSLDTYGQGYAEVDAPQENNIGTQETYKPRDPSTIYDTTTAARTEFSEAFSDLDMEELGKNLGDDAINFSPSSPFATMSDAFMRQAAKAKRESGANNIFPKLNEDGSWSLMETVSPEADLFNFDSRSDTLVDPEMSAEIDAEQAREDENKLPADVDWEAEAEKEIAEVEGAERKQASEALATRLLSDIKGVGPKTLERIFKVMSPAELLNKATEIPDGLVEPKEGGSDRRVLVNRISKIPGVSRAKARIVVGAAAKAPRMTKAADDFVNGPRREEIRAKWEAKAADRASSSEKRQASRRSSPITFIKAAIAKAKESRYARQKKVKGKWVDKTDQELVTVDGQAVNLIDLVKEGQRLFSLEQRADFTEGGPATAQRNGLMQVLGSLIEQGYEIRIGGYDIRSKQLKDINDISARIEQEEKAIAEAVLEWDLEADDPQLQGRLDELLRALDDIDPNIARTNSPLDRLKRERKAWAKKYVAYQKAKDKGDTSVEFPEKTPLLAFMDTAAGFENGKPVTLGKILNTTPAEPAPKDTQYTLTNEDGFQVFTGNKQEVQERIESDGQPYRITKKGEALTDEQFERERNVGFNERTEIDQLKNDNVALQDRVEEDSALGSGQFTKESTEANPDYSFEPDQSNVGDLKQIGLKSGTIASRVVDIARRTLRLEKPVSVISIKELLGLDNSAKIADLRKELAELEPDTPEKATERRKIKDRLKKLQATERDADKNEAKITELSAELESKGETAARRRSAIQGELATLESAANIDSYFGDPKVAKYVKDVAQELRANPQGGGRYIGFGDAHVILVDPDAGKNELDTAMIVAHELGHALYKEQLSATLRIPPLYNRLFDAFQKARDAKDAPAAYKEKHGFEEWYADQTANWAIGAYAKDRKKGLIGAHFQKVARALVSFYKAFSADMKKRFGKEAYTPEFQGYMDEVLKTRRDAETDTRSGARNATMQEKVIVRKMAEVIEKQQPGFINAILRQAQKIIRSDGFTPIYNFMFTADTRLRKIGGDKLADLFYARAQESKGKGRNKLGFLKTAMLEGNSWFNKLEDMVDGKLDSPEVQESIREAFSGTPTRDLTGNALAVRQWFDRFYDEYIEPSNTEIGRQRDYAPVVLKLSAVDQNPEGLVKLIMEADPEAKEADIKRAVQKLVNYQQAVMDEAPVDIKETNPAQSAEKAIELTKKVDRKKLQDAGFLEDPDVALMRYTSNIVRRVEWNRNTKDDFGNSIYEEELRKLDPKAQEEVKKIVHKYLGYTDGPMSPMWRTINSWGSVLQIFAILPLAVLGSLPEIAGPVIASKEFSAVTVAMKEIIKTVRNREEARALARDLGVVTSQSVANVLMSQAELDFMDTQARKLTDGFFRVTLLDTYTKFTREFASNMGVRFLEKHSNPETAGAFSKRYLKELGVTAEDVQAWSKSNQDFSTPEGKKVREALQRFVESSTLRPNAAERPLWASDPHWALVWQLKGFFYSYGKVMLAGSKREASARLEGASAKDVNTYAAMTGAAGVFALMGIATMPLAMVGMELREYAKFGLAWAIPGIDHEAKDYFRTDSLSWSEYLGAAFDRSFAAGPVSIAQQAMQAADWGRGVTGAAAVVAGPTAETVTRIFTDGFGSTFENRMLPTGLL